MTTNLLSLQPRDVNSHLCLLLGLEQLRRDSQQTTAYYYAKNSSRNVVSYIKQWLFFTIFFGLYLLPASIDNVILFAELMAITSGYDHIFLHKILDLPFDRVSFHINTWKN